MAERGNYVRAVAVASDDPGGPEARLREIVAADPPRTALFFDFDGTLAPIVGDPASARPVAGAVALLERLADRFGRVAVVSGRPRSFLAEHVGSGIDLSGLYGLETRIAGVDHDHADAERWRAVIDGVAATAGSHGSGDLPDGVLVESKGLSLTVHYRSVPDAADEVIAWADRVGRSTGLEVRPAKQSVELHPSLAVDKGTSVLALAEGCTTVAYLGDDIGDLPAFEALDVLAGRGITTCKVAVASAELPDVMASAADLVLDGPEAVLAALGPLT